MRDHCLNDNDGVDDTKDVVVTDRDLFLRHASHFLEICFEVAEGCRQGGEKALLSIEDLQRSAGNISDAQEKAATAYKENPEDYEAWELCWQFPFAIGIFGILGLSETTLLRWNQEGLSAAADIADQHLQTRLYMHFRGNLGRVRRNLGDLKSSEIEYRKALEYSIALKEPQFEATLLMELAALQFEMENLADSLALLLRANSLPLDRRDDRNHVIMLRAIGLTQACLGDPFGAEFALHRSRECARKAGLDDLEAACLSDLAALRSCKKNGLTALNDYHKAIAIVRRRGDREAEARILLSMAIVRLGDRDVEGAKEDIEGCMTLLDSLEDKKTRGRALAVQGAIEFRLGNVDRAIKCHEQSLKLAENSGDTEAANNARHNLMLTTRTITPNTVVPEEEYRLSAWGSFATNLRLLFARHL